MSGGKKIFMKDILVVGGAGYIGSHMVTMLLDKDINVTVLDNLSRGNPNVTPAPLHEIDLRDLNRLKEFFAKETFDLVMHFAAFAYVGESVEDPELYYQNNVVGTLNLLTALIKCREDNSTPTPLVFSSTCATYGEPKKVPIDETHPQLPINPYGRSKLFIEQVLQDYGKSYGLNSIALRYFNAAGCDPLGRVGERHFPETHLIPLVLAEALRLKKGGNPRESKLIVYGNQFSTPDGTCIRDFIHVEDICLAHLRAAERLCEKKVHGMESYNLALGYGFSVLEVIEACRQVTGQKIEFTVHPGRSGDPARLIGDATLANQQLGWSPNYKDLTEIIRTAWQWVERSENL